MSTRSFEALRERLAATPAGQAEHLAVAFLAQVNARMLAQGMSNTELARRLGTSPAYVTRLFRGSANPSLQTLVKLAQAVGASVQLGLTAAPSRPTRKTQAAMREARAIAAARSPTHEPGPQQARPSGRKNVGKKLGKTR